MAIPNIADSFLQFRFYQDRKVRDAYSRFFHARADYYRKHFGKQYAFETYEKHNYPHTVNNPPFLIIFNPKNENYFDFDNRGSDFINMTNFFDTKKMDFHYLNSKGKLFTSASLREERSDMPYVLNRIGGESSIKTRCVHENQFVTDMVFYLLPEDYHYFKNLNMLFGRNDFLQVHTPSSLEE